MLSTPTLHFLCGKPGAGKSTIARGLAQQHGAMLISEDIWLARLYGDQMKTFDDYLVFSQKLKSVVGPLVIELLNCGLSVVMDFPANTKTSRHCFRNVFEEADVAHVLHSVQTPDSLCLERIAKRNVERPEGSHQLTEHDFRYVSSFYQAPEDTEGFDIKTHLP